MYHHLRSRRLVARFKLVSWLLVLRWLVTFGAFGVLLWSLMMFDSAGLLPALGLLLLTAPLLVAQWGLSLHACCPICLTPPVAQRACSKNHHAKRLLGSYHLRVAVAVICKKRFRCPYCGETTVVDTRIR